MPSFFDILGVPERFDLDLADLEKRYKNLSRKWHPDKWARATPPERRRALEMTTALNDAYRALRDPVRRAEALLVAHGIKTLGEEAKADPELLELVMEARERLAEARAAGDWAALEQMAAEARARREATLTAVRDNFARWGETRDPAVLGALARALAAVRYYDRFLEEVEGGPSAPQGL